MTVAAAGCACTWAITAVVDEPMVTRRETWIIWKAKNQFWTSSSASMRVTVPAFFASADEKSAEFALMWLMFVLRRPLGTRRRMIVKEIVGTRPVNNPTICVGMSATQVKGL